MAFGILFQTCKRTRSEKDLEMMSNMIEKMDSSLIAKDSRISEQESQLESARQTIMEGPRTVTKWLPQETKVIKVEDTSQTEYLRNQLNQAISNPNCSAQIKVALSDYKGLLDTIDHYRSTTHYEAEDVRSGYTFRFQTETSRNATNKLTYETWPPLIPSDFKCPTASEPSDAPKDYSWGAILGKQDVFGNMQNELGISHGRKWIEFELSRSFNNTDLTGNGMWNISINPKIKYRKRNGR